MRNIREDFNKVSSLEAILCIHSALVQCKYRCSRQINFIFYDNHDYSTVSMLQDIKDFLIFIRDHRDHETQSTKDQLANDFEVMALINIRSAIKHYVRHYFSMSIIADDEELFQRINEIKDAICEYSTFIIARASSRDRSCAVEGKSLMKSVVRREQQRIQWFRRTGRFPQVHLSDAKLREKANIDIEKLIQLSSLDTCCTCQEKEINGDTNFAILAGCRHLMCIACAHIVLFQEDDNLR